MGLGEWLSFMNPAARIDAAEILQEMCGGGSGYFARRSKDEVSARVKSKKKRKAQKAARRRNRR